MLVVGDRRKSSIDDLDLSLAPSPSLQTLGFPLKRARSRSLSSLPRLDFEFDTEDETGPRLALKQPRAETRSTDEEEEVLPVMVPLLVYFELSHDELTRASLETGSVRQ